MVFVGCNVLGSAGVGSKIYQPIGGNLGCNVSVYSNGINIVRINFVEV